MVLKWWKKWRGKKSDQSPVYREDTPPLIEEAEINDAVNDPRKGSDPSNYSYSVNPAPPFVRPTSLPSAEIVDQLQDNPIRVQSQPTLLSSDPVYDVQGSHAIETRRNIDKSCQTSPFVSFVHVGTQTEAEHRSLQNLSRYPSSRQSSHIKSQHSDLITPPSSPYLRQHSQTLAEHRDSNILPPTRSIRHSTLTEAEHLEPHILSPSPNHRQPTGTGDRRQNHEQDVEKRSTPLTQVIFCQSAHPSNMVCDVGCYPCPNAQPICPNPGWSHGHYCCPEDFYDFGSHPHDYGSHPHDYGSHPHDLSGNKHGRPVKKIVYLFCSCRDPPWLPPPPL